MPLVAQVFAEFEIAGALVDFISQTFHIGIIGCGIKINSAAGLRYQLKLFGICGAHIYCVYRKISFISGFSGIKCLVKTLSGIGRKYNDVTFLEVGIFEFFHGNVNGAVRTVTVFGHNIARYFGEQIFHNLHIRNRRDKKRLTAVDNQSGLRRLEHGQ